MKKNCPFQRGKEQKFCEKVKQENVICIQSQIVSIQMKLICFKSNYKVKSLGLIAEEVVPLNHLTLSDPRGGPFCPLSNKSTVNFLWMDISTSIPYGFSSLLYLHCHLKSNIMFISKIFKIFQFLKISIIKVD